MVHFYPGDLSLLLALPLLYFLSSMASLLLFTVPTLGSGQGYLLFSSPGLLCSWEGWVPLSLSCSWLVWGARANMSLLLVLGVLAVLSLGYLVLLALALLASTVLPTHLLHDGWPYFFVLLMAYLVSPGSWGEYVPWC